MSYQELTEKYYDLDIKIKGASTKDPLFTVLVEEREKVSNQIKKIKKAISIIEIIYRNFNPCKPSPPNQDTK